MGSIKVIGCGFESYAARLDMLLCRAKFSVQVRDYVDLCVTRIADLGHNAARRCKGPETGGDRSPGMQGSANGETSHRHGDCGDPTTREVRNTGVMRLELPQLFQNRKNKRLPRVHKCRRRVVTQSYCCLFRSAGVLLGSTTVTFSY